jgi:C-terminal processing protease CtpA/Prc
MTAIRLIKALGILLLLSAVSLSAVEAQVYFRYRTIDTTFLIKQDRLNERPFYFPRYDDHPPLSSAREVAAGETILLNQLSELSSGDEQRYYLFCRIHSENIKNITLSLPAQPGNVVKYDLARDGFHTVIYEDVKTLLSGLDSLDDKIHITYEKLNKVAPSTLLVGEFWIGKDMVHKALAPMLLFRASPYNNPADSCYRQSPFYSYGLYSHFPNDQLEEDYLANFLVEGNFETRSQLYQVLLSLFKHYKYFAARGVDPLTFTSEFEKQFHVLNVPLCEYVSRINTFIKSRLNDPHFHIETECKGVSKARSPVLCADVMGAIQVAAVFDDSLKKQLPLGSRILSVNGVSIKPGLDHKTVNKLLTHDVGAAVAIQFSAPGGNVKELSYKIKDKYSIPANFRPQHLALKEMDDSTVYYKVNRIDAALPTDFMSRLSTINSKKKLIIDFRGNGGGDFLSGALFLSTIIGSRFKYYDFKYRRSNQMDSVIVAENTTPFSIRKDINIVVLIDEGTACTTELLVNALRKNRSRVMVVGRSRSMGALSIAQFLHMKDGLKIVTNALNESMILVDGKSIEGIGLHPDVLIPINTVDDLQPYKDKVLQSAIALR